MKLTGRKVKLENNGKQLYGSKEIVVKVTCVFLGLKQKEKNVNRISSAENKKKKRMDGKKLTQVGFEPGREVIHTKQHSALTGKATGSC